MEAERDRLERLYGELGDEHLQDLADDASDLTDEARDVLAHELRQRGLAAELPPVEPVVATVEPELEQGFGAGIPGMFPSAAAAMEQVLEPQDREKDGLTRLISFYDGMELSKACAALEDEGLEPVIEPIAGDAQGGVPPRFEIWLESADIESAKALLRAKMGLFPLAEVDENGDGAASFEGEMVVAEFESASEAAAVRATLEAAGIPAHVGSDSDSDSEATTYPVLVAAEDHERALELLAERMGLA